MDSLLDLIHIKENSLSNETCESLITFFENNKDKHERVDNGGYPTFTQLNLTEHRQGLEELHKLIIKTIFSHKEEYYKFVDERVFPKSHALEQFRIKKYNPDGVDKFDTHVDVMDFESSRRFLSFLWYLNDVEVGGETIFKDLTVQPKQGKVIIFPPLWMYPHRGNPPISNPKYVMSAYLHYK